MNKKNLEHIFFGNQILVYYVVDFKKDSISNIFKTKARNYIWKNVGSIEMIYLKFLLLSQVSDDFVGHLTCVTRLFFKITH